MRRVLWRRSRLLIIIDREQLRHWVAADEEREVLVFTISQGVDNPLLLPETLIERPWFRIIWGKVDEGNDERSDISQVKKINGPLRGHPQTCRGRIS